MKAIWNNEIIAESNDTIVIENNHYFPENSIQKKYFKASNTHSSCPWKGKASYFSIEVNKKTNEDAAWFYPNPFKDASEIKNHIAFWKGVQIVN